ncbi:N-acetylmuramidase domain-containing protein [Flavobacterium sp. GT3P67]|uniref:N-acetylmuramidase domain-containing protein n=1 Tax=Flavobacterium sp. GT3P67 TaxID=2541722 RepID=UPI00104DCF51|nr:N-acetylmuramidase domain-containing protein [Flavobacterium sp. GT3P67]TDE53747.1 N-acetylmuramidase family protein [Flavobacterium sp. GT3P67]
MKKITLKEIQTLSKEFGIPTSRIQAIKEVESGGIGFDSKTGKIIIQFEPVWFKRQSPYSPSGKWSVNGVERQELEWKAFNDAFEKDPNAAMEATSIGLMQVMGFHWKLLGFKSVGEMWDYAKESEYNQLRLSLLFIKSNKKMFKALIAGNWKVVAYYYNGAHYWKLKYDVKLANAEKLYL